MDKVKIVVSSLGDNYKAAIEGQADKYASGRTIAEAVGGLILTHRKDFDIKIDETTMH